MPVPIPVGRTHYNEPRAVVVREPQNLDSHHSAIHCGVNVYIDSLSQGKYLLQRWPEIMAELDLTIQAMLDNFDQTPMGETNKIIAAGLADGLDV